MAESQLNLELDIKYDASLSDFSGPGWSPIVDAVRQFHIGLIHQLYLFGENGTGKTHLLTAICESFVEMNRSAITLSLSDLLHKDTNILSSLETFDVIAIDDVDVIEGHPEWQEALFHLINRSKELQKQLIFASNKPASDMQFVLKDLTTRLSHATAFRVPDGHNVADRKQMIQSILHRKGWQFHPKIIDHLIAEGPHRIGEIMQVLTYIQPMFAHIPTRRKISNTMINDAIRIINEQTLLAELEDIQDKSQTEQHYIDNMAFDF